MGQIEMANSIFCMGIDYVNDYYPRINFSIPSNRRYDWLKIGEMIEGALPVDIKVFKSIKIKVTTSLKKFDALSFDGGILISSSAKQFLELAQLEGIEFLPALVNDMDYAFLIVRRTIDCLDRDRSILVPFRSDPNSIKTITKYVFKKNLVPKRAIFKIPQRNLIFVTDTIKDEFQKSGLVGFKFIDWENPPEGVHIF
jgi:hypothetical protein